MKTKTEIGTASTMKTGGTIKQNNKFDVELC